MNDCVYIHESIAIEGGARGRMIEMIRSRWAPHVAKAHGIRLVGVWATVGSTATWPEVRVQWEMDDWLAFARAQSGQHPMEERDVFLTELWNQALDFRRGGHAMLLRPAPFSPDLAAITANDIAGDVILHEDVRSRPGCMREYHEALGAEHLPLAEELGLKLLGAYEHALVPNVGLNLWALRGWDQWQALMEHRAGSSTMGPWNERWGAWLTDVDSFIAAAPPSTALRT